MAESPSSSETFSPLPPQEFLDGCTQVARFIDAFNAGTGLQDPQAVTFLTQFASCPALGNLYLDTGTWETMDTDPQLPEWLRRKFLMDRGIFISQSLPPEQSKQLSILFERWAQEQGYPNEGPFYMVSPKDPIVPTHQFKIYLGGKSLLKCLAQNQLTKIFEDLEAATFLPFDCRNHNDMAVLYYSKDISLSPVAEDIFKKHQLPFRGPAEDVDALVAHNGQIFLTPIDSNDLVLNRFHFEKPYSDQMFLKRYTESCYHYGKNPAKPYQTSFVWLKAPNAEDPQQLIARAEQLVQRPVLLRPPPPKAVDDPNLPNWLRGFN